MLTLTLEPTDDRANPAFNDAAGCEKWLAQLQLTNLQLAHSLLLTEVNELNRFPMRGPERLNTLELLRDTVHHVQEEYAKRLALKPLPLNERDLIVFFAIVQLWQAMAVGYQRCLQAQVAGDKHLAKDAAMLCQRALLYGGLAIFQHWRTGYEFDGKFWRQIHGLYAYAEDQGLLFEKVPDPLNPTQPPGTCHDLYLKILLTGQAHPAELTRAQLHLLDGWFPQWAGMLTVARSYTVSRGDAPPLAFDLNDPRHGLQPAKALKHDEGVRYLAMVPLSKWIRVKTILLQQGKTPREVELGATTNGHECIELLTLLHRRWCENPDMDFTERNQPGQRAILMHGFRNICAQLSGKAQQNATNPKQEETAPALETWLIDSDTVQGAQLTREDVSGGQLSRNQLVALRPGDAGAAVLCVVTWAKVLRTGQLRIGVRYLPGKAEAATLQATAADQAALEKSAPAFLLQAIPELKLPPSLVIPHNWFKPGRVVELLNQKAEKQNVKMGFSVERGADYERVSFTPA
ncbi:MAG: hypothetical protein HY938_05915 [Nitrosomonadales bacterium]|nr:hypothetical protein [Nitrosomonadales bacterium]